MKPFLAIAAACLATAAVAAEDGMPPAPQAAEPQPAIKTLSTEDIDDLRHGRGRRFDRAAALNGLPGPAELLELKDRIPLTLDQVAVVRYELDDMRRRAKRLGARYIALERKLNEDFASGAMTEARLAAQLRRIAEVERQLRRVHLMAHLRMRDALSAEQIARYNRLRSDAGKNPTESVPAGPDPGTAAPAHDGP